MNFSEALFVSDKTSDMSEKNIGYNEENKSPFLVLINRGQFKLITYDQLYAPSVSIAQLKKEIRLFFQS
jgi:hypothetical protein